MYAVMFLLWSAFTRLDFTAGPAPTLISLAILIVIAILAGRLLHYSSWKDILPYSLGWAIIVAVLDALLTVPFTGWQIFLQPSVLIGYALIILVPLLAFDRAPIASDDVLKRQT